MKRAWSQDELAEQWTLQPDERAFVDSSKTDHTRVGAALLLKWFQQEGRFPRYRNEIPAQAVMFVAQQLGVTADAYLAYDWQGRSIKTHRAEIRAWLGFREATVDDATHMTAWLVAHDVSHTRNRDAFKAVAYARFRDLHIEPATPDRVDRLVRSAMHAVDDQVYAQTLTRLPLGTREQLQALLQPSDSAPVTDGSEGVPTGWSPLADLKADPGPLTLATIAGELAKLEQIRRLDLPQDLFAGVAPKHVETYRQRVVAKELHEVQRHPEAVRYTLLAAFCWLRSRELIDTIGELLMDIIHHLGTKAERRVDKVLLQDLKRVQGKTNLLF